jgi:hypothetical protein
MKTKPPALSILTSTKSFTSTSFFCGLFLFLVQATVGTNVRADSLLPPGWDPLLAGDQVLQRLVTVTAPRVKGAHDAAMALIDGHAYIVAEVNDVKPGESAGWPEIYVSMSIVDLESLVVEKRIDSTCLTPSRSSTARRTSPSTIFPASKTRLHGSTTITRHSRSSVTTMSRKARSSANPP